MGALDEFAPKTENDRRGDTSLLFAFAGVIAFLHLLTNGPYGFHREEFLVLSDARHLDWEFVAYPPVTPVLERIGAGAVWGFAGWVAGFIALLRSRRYRMLAWM